MRRPRICLGVLFLSSLAACSDGKRGSPDASGVAGASGGGAAGTGGGIAGTGGGAAGTGGGQAGNSPGGRGGAGGQAGAGGSGGQAGSNAGAGGQTGGAGGTGGQAGSGTAGAGGRGGAGGQAGSGSAGSGGRGGAGGGDACAAIAGKTFASVEPHECGRGPDGGAFCNWRVSFTMSTFDWQHSDFAETGTYSCNGNTIAGQRSTAGGPIAGQYDAATRTLTWDGIAYLPP